MSKLGDYSVGHKTSEVTRHQTMDYYPNTD